MRTVPGGFPFKAEMAEGLRRCQRLKRGIGSEPLHSPIAPKTLLLGGHSTRRQLPLQATCGWFWWYLLPPKGAPLRKGVCGLLNLSRGFRSLYPPG